MELFSPVVAIALSLGRWPLRAFSIFQLPGTAYCVLVVRKYGRIGNNNEERGVPVLIVITYVRRLVPIVTENGKRHQKTSFFPPGHINLNDTKFKVQMHRWNFRDSWANIFQKLRPSISFIRSCPYSYIYAERCTYATDQPSPSIT